MIFSNMDSLTQITQAQMIATWKDMYSRGVPPLSFDDVQYRVYSQNGEDGILLYIFTMLGTKSGKVLEICAGNGQECNSANLILNRGWEGYLLDGDQEKVESGIEFYRSCPDTRIWPPEFRCEWITKENINDIIAKFKLEGEIDLLSLDIDGNDYWIFDAIDLVQPRVVIAEYQHAWGPNKSFTQRYDPNFSYAEHRKLKKRPWFCGASLAALQKVAKRKGMRLVGCERKCINAIFIRDGIGEDLFPEVNIESCFEHSMAKFNIARLNALVDPKDEFWEEV